MAAHGADDIRALAKDIKNAYAWLDGDKRVEELLNDLLDPEKSLDDANRLLCLKTLIAGGSSFEDFAQTGSVLCIVILHL